MLRARWLCPLSCRRGGRGTGRVGAVPWQGSPCGLWGEGGLPAPARQRRWELSTVGRSLCPLGRFPLWPVAVCGCRRGPGGPAVPVPAAHPEPGPHVWGGRSGRCRGPGQTPPALVRCRPQPRGLLVVGLCHRCCCCCCCVWEGFSQTLALARSPGEKGDVAGVPSPSLPPLPSPPVAGARHRGAAAESAGQSRPCPGGSRVCRGGSSSGALWAQSDCPTSLPVQGRTDGRRSPATPGAAEPPGRSRAACAEADAAACPARGPAPGWGQPCLARPVPPRLQLSCLGPRLFWVPFQLPVPSVWLCGLLSVAGPACGRLQFSLQAQLSSGSCSRVSALVSGPARGRLQFISMPACGWFQLGCGSGSAAAPAPRRFQFLSAPAPFGSSSGLLKRSWLLARS